MLVVLLFCVLLCWHLLYESVEFHDMSVLEFLMNSLNCTSSLDSRSREANEIYHFLTENESKFWLL